MAENQARANRTSRPALLARGWLLALLFACDTAVAASGADAGDEYLTGYLSSILEQRLKWEHDSYHIETHDGVAIITLFKDAAQRTGQAEHALAEVEGLYDFHIRIQTDPQAQAAPGDAIPYPRGDLFLPLMADPREPQSYVSFVHTDAGAGDITAALLGLGKIFGLYRWPGESGGVDRQIGVSVAAFSQFDLDAPSEDLVNTDYLLGFPLTFRHATFSGRLRLFHQSSHLGDEALLRGTVPKRIDIDFEAIDLILAKDPAPWRIYAGGDYIIRRARIELKRESLRAGVEYRGRTPVFRQARLVGGLDSRWLEQRHWAAGTGFKIGLEFGHPYPNRYGTRFMLEAYKGYVPFGQFYGYDVKYYGLGYYLDF